MKASENPVSLHIFVSVCISIRAHVYINSYIHELLIVLMLILRRLHGFETSFWLITWLRVALIALVPSCIIFTQALRAGSSNSILDGSLDGDVTPCIHH